MWETETCDCNLQTVASVNSVQQPFDFAVFRLTTSFDEVGVYPIPAVLYMVKNLLQVRVVLL